MKSDAFQARHEHRRIGQLPLGAEESATTSSNICSASEYVSEGLIYLFFRNASLFIGMTPAGAITVRIDIRTKLRTIRY